MLRLCAHEVARFSLNPSTRFRVPAVDVVDGFQFSVSQPIQVAPTRVAIHEDRPPMVIVQVACVFCPKGLPNLHPLGMTVSVKVVHCPLMNPQVSPVNRPPTQVGTSPNAPPCKDLGILPANLKRQRIHQKFLPATLIFQLPVGWKVRDVNRRRLRLLRPTTPDALCAFSVDGGGDGAWVSSSPASK